MTQGINRRELITAVGATAVGLAGLSLVHAAKPQAKNSKPTFRYCFNTSTIRGQKKTVAEQVDIAAKAGYSGIEPWVREIAAYEKQGGSLKDLKKRIADLGMKVESAIGFGRWIDDDPVARAKGLEDAKRDMELVKAIGGTRIAAPPTGATRQTDLDLFKAAERYRELLKIGRNMGVVPQVEVWGFSKSLSRLGEAVFVAIESGHPDACLLPDVYHIYKGGSDFAGLNLIAGKAIHVFHVNDYPADPPREKIGDADRVYPGDGVAPWKKIFKSLARTGFEGVLSLELFNRDYWKQDALTVAKTGLEKTRAVVRKYAG